MSIVIEKNVPIRASNKRHALTEALRSMEIGDSFAVPWGIAVTTRATVYYIQKTTERRYTCRKASDTELRVWRIADEVAA